MNSFELIRVLSSFLNNKPLNEPVSDWNGLISLAKRQSVYGMLYPPIEKSDFLPEREICANLESAYFLTIQNMMNYEFVKNKIVSAFDKSGITAVFFKGIVVKDCYPVPELRTMGDIDFFVRLDERERSDKVLMSLGAIKESGVEPIYTYWLNGILLEVHTAFSDKMYNKDKASAVYKDIWNNIEKHSEYTHIPSPQFHLMLLIIHTFRHFTNVGCGIRLFMDIGVFFEHYKDKIDVDKLKRDLEECEIDTFSKLAFYLNHRWFGYEDIYESEYDEQIYKDVTDYIMACGTFGFDFGTTGGKTVRVRLTDKKGIGRFFTKVTLFLQRTFPTYTKMKQKYVFVKKCPILLPVGYIVNIFSQLKRRGKHVTKFTKDVFVSNKEDEQVYKLFDRLGM